MTSGIQSHFIQTSDGMSILASICDTHGVDEPDIGTWMAEQETDHTEDDEPNMTAIVLSTTHYIRSYSDTIYTHKGHHGTPSASKFLCFFRSQQMPPKSHTVSVPSRPIADPCIMNTRNPNLTIRRKDLRLGTNMRISAPLAQDIPLERIKALVGGTSK